MFRRDWGLREPMPVTRRASSCMAMHMALRASPDPVRTARVSPTAAQHVGGGGAGPEIGGQHLNSEPAIQKEGAAACCAARAGMRR